jgi:hypothetical protein
VALTGGGGTRGAIQNRKDFQGSYEVMLPTPDAHVAWVRGLVHTSTVLPCIGEAGWRAMAGSRGRNCVQTPLLTSIGSGVEKKIEIVVGGKLGTRETDQLNQFNHSNEAHKACLKV